MRSLLFLALLTVSVNVFAQSAVSFYNQGVEFKKSKKFQEAANAFQKAVQLDPSYNDAMYELGWCYNEFKKYDSAMQVFRRVRRFWPEIPKLHFELAYAFEKSQQTDSAIASYLLCLKYKPDYINAFKQLGHIYYSKEDYIVANEYYSKAILNSKTEITDYQLWYRKGFGDNALKNYAPAKESLLKALSYKKDYLNIYLELGYASSRLKQSDEAIDWYRQAMQVDPKSHIPSNGIAEVYRDNKKMMDSAAYWYQKTLEIKPRERKACFGLGYINNSQGKYQDALPYLQQALESENTYVAAWVEQGYSYYKLGNMEQATRSLYKALELNANNENARYYLTLIFISQKNKYKAQEMVDALKKVGSRYTQDLQDRVNKM